MSIDQTTATAPFSEFVGRHVGPRGDDVERMLEVIGQPSLDAMCDRAIPGAIRSEAPLDLEAAASESAVIDELRAFAARNTVNTSLIGLGYYGTLSRFEAWLIVPAFWLLMLAWSKPWLDRFRYGPFEWAWRSLSRWQFQPMRRARAPAQAGA